MNQNVTSDQLPGYPDDEIDLREFFATLWAGKWLIIAITFIFASGGVFYALSKPDIYRASALLSPAQDQGSSRLGGQLSGLASLAGVNLGEGGRKQNDHRQRSITIPRIPHRFHSSPQPQRRVGGR